MAVLADDLESLAPKLARDCGERHLVNMSLRNGAMSPVHDDYATTRPQRQKDMPQHRLWITEFVKGVADQHCVRRACWQARIVLFSDDRVNIVLSAQKRPRPQEEQRQSAKIHRQNPTPFADGESEFQCEVTRSGAKVDHRVSGVQVQGLNNIQRPLPLVSLGLYCVKLAERSCKRE